MTESLSRVIHDFDLRRAFGPAWPFKTKPPLHIDPDAELAGAIALQGLQAVAGERPQIVQAYSRAQNVEPLISLPREALERLNKLTFGKLPGASVSVSEDHERLIERFMSYVNHNSGLAGNGAAGEEVG